MAGKLSFNCFSKLFAVTGCWEIPQTTSECL